MTAAAHTALDSRVLNPLWATIRATSGTDRPPGLVPGLVVPDSIEWPSARALVDGTLLPTLLDAAALRWRATAPAAAALAWKAYTYWLALPAVLGWAAARRVPLVTPDDVLVHISSRQPLVTLGLRGGIRVAVLPSDPLAVAVTAVGAAGSHPVPWRSSWPHAGRSHPPTMVVPEVVVVADEAALLAEMRASLLDAHLTPMLEQLQRRVRLGGRTLLGSLASGVAHGIIQAADALPGSTVANAGTLLDALGVADLVELIPGSAGEPTVRRKTCCLAFTLPEPKICAGCCIRTHSESSPRPDPGASAPRP